MAEFRELLESPQILASALKSVRQEMSEKQYGDLITLSTTKGGIHVTRYSGNRLKGDTITSCAKIGSFLTKHFDGVGPLYKMSWIGSIELDSKEQERWVIRPQVKAAVKALGWV
jgi:hypothetical protein